MGKVGFADIVKINKVIKKPVCKLHKLLVHLVTDCGGLFFGTVAQPIAFNRMNYAHTHYGSAPRDSGVYSCKVVFDISVFLVPRGLVADAGRVVTLCLALH